MTSMARFTVRLTFAGDERYCQQASVGEEADGNAEPHLRNVLPCAQARQVVAAAPSCNEGVGKACAFD